MSTVIYEGMQGPLNGSSAPAYTLKFAVQSDSTDVPIGPDGERVCRGFRALADGNVEIVTLGDDTITIPVLRGDEWRCYIKRVRDTNTTLLNNQIVLIY